MIMPVQNHLILTPQPVTLEGQRTIVGDLQVGESLQSFLERHIDLTSNAWEVRINGVFVPHELWPRVKPKNATVIEVRGAVKKQALVIIAFAALTYFTFGFGAATAGAWGAGAAAGAFGGGLAGALFAGAVYVGGSILINKVLGPKLPAGASAQKQDSVYSLDAARNQPRAYEPMPLLFGSVRITPDLASLPYTWHEGDDQYLGFVLNAGINVDSISDLKNGDTLLTSYEGANAYFNGFTGMSDEDIPLYSNADTISGGELDKNGTWVERTSSTDTVRLQVNIEYVLGDTTNKGKPTTNSEEVRVEYRRTGESAWVPFETRMFYNQDYNTKRVTLSKDVEIGQYDVRVRRAGYAWEEKNGRAQFTWLSLTSVQKDSATYDAIARIGVRVKATGQLNGAMDEITGLAISTPVPVWNGTQWVTQATSNPGAHILAYARGIKDENGKLVAGIGLTEDMIDVPAMQAFMLHCQTQGFTYDFYIKDARSHQEVVDSIALAGMGHSTWAGGKFGVVWASDDQPLSGIVNMATIKRGQFQVDYTIADAADGIEFTYWDKVNSRADVVRVSAPGVTTMLNPAKVEGEGITDADHAAQIARFHLAQSLYQYKDISYSTDLEHLSYRRMSLLALQHDLTQWGYGGRLRAADIVAGSVVLTLDEAVPAPTSGNAFIGLRIPGERVYRVFSIEPFTETSETITLAEPWPEDAPLPGSSADNPAHDTIWIYDFKATPGARVRVVSIEPESGLSGARVAVVPESPEYWEYIRTGVYERPDTPSLLLEKPIASNLQVSERQVVQGDTVYTELQVRFDVAGPMAYCELFAARQIGGVYGELVRAAESRAPVLSWRIPSAGTYVLVVRPYTVDGIVGVPVSMEYSTAGADLPPASFDVFEVTELAGGVRKYNFGYAEASTQPADYAGAEIRYIAGSQVEPEWGGMIPVGEDGYHTVAFEAVTPVAGTWTFACRPRNTSGQLGPSTYLVKTLDHNVGEVIEDLKSGQEALEEVGLETQQQIAQEILDRQSADAALELAQAQLAAEAAVLRAQIGDILAADEWVLGNTYPSGDLVQHDGKLYRALQDVPANTPITDAAYWEVIGNYASLGEAVSAVAAQVEVHTTKIEELDGEVTAISETVSQHAARMPAGTGSLATEASVTAVDSASVSRDQALGTRVTTIEARLPAGSGALAEASAVQTLTGRVTTAEGNISANSSAITQLQSDVSGKASTTALNALTSRVTETEGDIDAVSSSLTQVQAELGFKAIISWDFNLSNTATPPYNGFTQSGATIANFPANNNFGAAALTSTGVDPQFFSPLVSFVGNNNNKVRAMIRKRTAGTWDGTLYWQTPGHGWSASYKTTVPDIPVNVWTVVEWDMSANTDWQTSTIQKLRFDFVATDTAIVDIRWISVGSSVGGPSSSAGAVTSLDARVTSAEGTITSQASQITSLTASVGDANASITSLSQVVASASVGNGVTNPSFEDNADHWTLNSAASILTNASQARTGSKVLLINGGGTTGIATTNDYLPVRVGQTVRFQMYAGTYSPVPPNGSYVRINVRWYNSAKAQQSYVATPAQLNATGAAIGLTKVEGVLTVPSGIAFLRISIETTSASGIWRCDDVVVEVLNDIETNAYATAGVTIDVNGYVTGYKQMNNGTTSMFAIVADQFSVVSPSGGARLEWSNGNQRVYDANGVLRVRMGVW